MSDGKNDRAGTRAVELAWTACIVVLGILTILFSGVPRTPRVAAPVATPSATASPAPPAPPPERVILRLAGSGIVGARLAPALAEAWLTSMGASGVRAVASGAEETRVSGMENGTVLVVTVAAGGTETAFEALASGAADVGMASRRVTATEAAKLAALGSMTSPGHEHVLALDGLAVVVNPANPLRRLERGQLAAIFSGAVTDWSRVGGRRGPIHVYGRDAGSGTMDAFQSLVLGERTLVAGARRLPDGPALARAVEGDRAAIGFVALAHAGGTKPIAIAERGATAFLPTALSIATEDYPLARRLLLYTGRPGAKTRVDAFVAFALGKQGQAVVRREGFVDLTVQAREGEAPRARTPPAYAQLTRGALRLSTDFRFEVGSAQLDARARRDVERVAEFLQTSEASGRRLVLVGFTDGRGSRRRNLALSRERAAEVARALEGRGAKAAAAVGLGPILPVADDATPEGRERNRRVEVWAR